MKNDLLDKLLLIYEFDTDSSLFARVAQHYFEQKEIKKAEEILENGLKLYPDYPTGHIIMGKVALVNGEYEKAKEHFLIASKLINSTETLAYYNTRIENNINKDRELSESTRTPFFNDDLLTKEFDSEEEDVFNEDSIDEIEKIANELRTAKIPKAEQNYSDTSEELDFEFKNKQMVSEPLAGIYFAQGNFAEAMDVYQKLIKIHPEKEAVYNAKIIEIKNILDKRD